jgi:hypothetical protein
LPLVVDVGDLDGLPRCSGPSDRALAEPDRRCPQGVEQLRAHLMDGSHIEALCGFVQLENRTLVAP